MKEELLEEVSAREMLVSRRGWEATAVSASKSSDSEKSDLGGEGPAIGTGTGTFTLSKALRVRRIGPLLWNAAAVASESSLVLLGSVSAQFSHGMALFLSFSSYVLPKLDSRRLLRFNPLWRAATLGLVGGVSTVEGDKGDTGDLIPAVWSARPAPFSWSEDAEVVLLPRRAIPARPFEGLRDREPVLGRRVLTSSSRHDVQPTVSPSVTINGVGP